MRYLELASSILRTSGVPVYCMSLAMWGNVGDIDAGPYSSSISCKKHLPILLLADSAPPAPPHLFCIRAVASLELQMEDRTEVALAAGGLNPV